MDIQTDLPGVQLYTGNFLNGAPGKGGRPLEKHAGFCLETQYYPDSPNRPDFPSCVFKAGEHYRSKTSFLFSTV
ncbi:MAG: Aldose 1-epimerase [Firmicutes bacterium ADurb.Bin262]|nr:MAG: Aldose 1-epimerase [Firmicutes bacterium ADurb.Bin262]